MEIYRVINKREHFWRCDESCEVSSGLCTFVPHEVDVDGGDRPPAQRLPPSYHHVEQAPAVKHRLHRLLPVLIGQVHVVNLQQPIVHPGGEKSHNDSWLFDKQWLAY